MRIILMCLILGGCATERIAAKCADMGFVEGTPDHRQCQLELRKAAIMAPRTIIKAN